MKEHMNAKVVFNNADDLKNGIAKDVVSGHFLSVAGDNDFCM